MAKRNIEGIQVLRGLAALMVVFHHARNSVSGALALPEFGAAGVDVFFVISGFVMAHTTRNIVDENLGQRLRGAADFLSKRFLRVVPLYWIALIWTARRELSQGAFNSGLLKDFFFVPRFNPIYPNMIWPSVIQGWTLNYEMFFYAVFAVSILMKRWRIWALIGSLIFLVGIGFFALDRESLLASETLGVAGVLARFYTNDILLEFIYGVLLQRVLSKSRSPYWPRWAYAVLLTVGFIFLAIGFNHLPRGITVGLPALLIVWVAMPAFAGLRLPTCLIIGDASYAIYLFHWAAFGAANPIADRVRLMLDGGLPSWLIITIMMSLYILIATLAGVVVHRLLERPLMRGAASWFAGRRMRASL